MESARPKDFHRSPPVDDCLVDMGMIIIPRDIGQIPQDIMMGHLAMYMVEG